MPKSFVQEITKAGNEMKKVLKLAVIFLLVFSFFNRGIEAQENLRDFLSNPNCKIACFLGIEPGVTTQANLEDILNEYHISYDIKAIGKNGQASRYFFDANTSLPFLVNGPNSVGVFLSGNQVVEVDFSVTGITVTDLLNWFGAPTAIRYSGSNSLYYSDLGLIFIVSNQNQNMVTSVSIHTQGDVTLTVADLQICQGPASLCNIATATFTPTPTATPTAVSSGFPTTNVLDNFNRANGALGSNWGGNVNNYSISSNQLHIGQDWVYWTPNAFGASQEAYITLANIDQSSNEIDLVLKVQNGDPTVGNIEVLYYPPGGYVQVWTYTTGGD
jgi:hypothetical protein